MMVYLLFRCKIKKKSQIKEIRKVIFEFIKLMNFVKMMKKLRFKKELNLRSNLENKKRKRPQTQKGKK